ncbi:MAG: hypothetical protein WAM92_11830 [Mycobacterium sp.]
MTGPHDNSDTRPISVAELLARNGTIGAPPVAGRRRRRRGNADAVTVAELTGEIPVIRDEEPAAEQEQAPEPTDGVTETVGEPEPEVTPEAEPEGQSETAEAAAEEHDVQAPDQAPDQGDDLDADVSAEEMLPDHVDVEFDEDADENDAAVAVEESDEKPSYLDAVHEPLFGGRTGEDLTRDGAASQTVTELPEVPAETTSAEDHEEALPPTRLQQVGRGALVVLQSILAVAFGAGLFIAFDELWRWNKIVALVLSVLVILGLVVAVRIVRKTEDIASTLIAVAVGALVTLGPLALLQSG